MLKHGHATPPTKTYKAWQSMKERCYNPKYKGWSRYGGRGIKVCDRWLKFDNFLADMGEFRLAMTLERINNDVDYEPSNCKWASLKEQARNRVDNHFLTYNGETRCMAEWAEVLNIKYDVLKDRVRRGWDLEKIHITFGN